MGPISLGWSAHAIGMPRHKPVTDEAHSFTLPCAFSTSDDTFWAWVHNLFRVSFSQGKASDLPGVSQHAAHGAQLTPHLPLLATHKAETKRETRKGGAHRRRLIIISKVVIDQLIHLAASTGTFIASAFSRRSLHRMRWRHVNEDRGL